MLKITDLEFDKGDVVVTVMGRKGTIIDICMCEKCEQRGFYELICVMNDGSIDYITSVDALSGFDRFYKIGNHKFNHPFEENSVLEQIDYHTKTLKHLQVQLQVIRQIEKEEK